MKKDYQASEVLARDLVFEKQGFRNIAFIRDPVDRFFSSYFEVYVRHIGQSKFFEREGIQRELKYAFLNSEDHIDRLEEFLDHIEKRGFFDLHLARQVDYLKDQKIDEYYTIDELTWVINQIRRSCLLQPLPEELKKFRKRPKKKIFNYRKEDVAPALIERIKYIYRSDVLFYNQVLEANNKAGNTKVIN